MIDELKPYPEYKDTGLPWLGQVPGHWQSAPGFAAFREKQVKNIGLKEKRVLSLSYGRIVVKPEGLRGLMPDSFETYQIVEPGDIIIRSTDLQNDKTSLRIGMVRDHGIITSAYICMKITDAALPEFGYQLLNTYDLCKVLYGMGSGLRQNLVWTDFKRMPVFLPALEEQAAIVRFLDHATHRMDKAIRAKSKTIALLNEQKQAIIHRAVTRGLDPDVPLKDSGIPWLGQIPAHWEVRRAKYLFCEIDERSINGDEELLSVSHITGVTPRSEKNITMFKAESYAGHKVCRPGDLVINTMWAWMAALGVSKHTGIISPAYAVYRPREPRRLTDEYVDFLLRTKPYISNYICRSTGVRASRLRLYPEEFFRISIIIPPIVEQESIIIWLRTETREIVTATQRIEREIELLREYRTRLIADVVTGKLDVREAAARLPEIESAPADETELAEPEESGEELAEENA